MSFKEDFLLGDHDDDDTDQESNDSDQIQQNNIIDKESSKISINNSKFGKIAKVLVAKGNNIRRSQTNMFRE